MIQVGRKAAPNRYIKTDFGYVVVIDSPTRGELNVKISECDYEKVKNIKWSVASYGNNHSNVGSHKLYANETIGLMHRYIMDAPKQMVVDHINGDGLDNRRENLRICTQSENRMNANRLPHHNATGTIGVCWNNATQKWLAYICRNYKQHLLGNFNNFEDAIKARKEAERMYYPEIK